MKKLLVFFLLLLWKLAGGAGEVDVLVKQLGADSFAVREAASRALREIGPPALEAVRLAGKNSDPEIRSRAQKILPFLEMGIGPDWPESVLAEALKSRTYEREALENFMDRLFEEMKEASLPYFIYQLKGVASSHSVKKLEEMLEKEGMDQEILRYLSLDPENEQEAILLSSVLLEIGDVNSLKRVLALKALPESQKEKGIEAVLERLRVLRSEKKFAELKEEAEFFSSLAPKDARIMYFHGIGANGSGEEELAWNLSAQALELDPEDEVKHYFVAEMLQEMRLNELAAREWMKVLEIPPEKSVYDVNAYLNLGKLNNLKGDYERAATAYRNALQLYKNAKERGEGFFLVGADEEALEKIIEDLVIKANAVDMGANPLEGTMGLIVKGIDGDELKKLKKSTTGEISFTVQPYGFRLLEKAPSTLIFDRDKQELYLTLNDKPFGEGIPYTWREGKNLILVRTLDMRYFMELDEETRMGAVVRKFELDYLFKMKGNEQIRALRDTEMILNGDKVTWEELTEGIPMDFLPEKIDFKLKGLNEAGSTINAEMNFDPRKEAPDVP